MKSYRDNGAGARNKTVYDDVFGGAPKFGATTLPPRLEDYTEIFQGFHASRGSSIPVLDLPPPYEEYDDVWFDVQTSKLDYSEVFGGFSGLDFAVSYQELFGRSKVRGDDSSDEAWTPAQSESLSDESDPYASLEKNQHESVADPDQSFVIKKQLNLSQNTASLESEKDVSSGVTNDSRVVDNQALPSKVENEKLFSLSLNDNHHCASKDFGRVTEGKRLEKSLSQPLDSGFGSERCGNHVADTAGNRPLLSVSDLGLKTQPSQLPPPSRPPPALTSKKGDSGRFSSKLKTSKSYAFERMTDDRSPPYFDVEIDASSSAAADAEAMKDAVEQAQAKLRSAKEKMDRKKEGLQSRSKTRVENNVGDKNGRVNEEDNMVVLETFEERDGKNVETREVCGLEENEVRQEVCNKSYREVEHGEIKTPSEADENELFENLIEIQLKDDDMLTGGKSTGVGEKVVTENGLKNDKEKEGYLMGSDSYDWEDYDIGLEESIEKEHEMGAREDAKEVEKPGPETETTEGEDKKDHERGEREKIVDWDENAKKSLNDSDQEESDNVSEIVLEQDENTKKQTLDHNEKILQEEDKKNEVLEQTLNHAGANEKIETINEMDCYSEESKTREEASPGNDDVENEEEGAKWEDDEWVNSSEANESSSGEHSEASDGVFQVVDDNEILQPTGNIQHDTSSEKNEKVEGTVEQIHESGKESFCSSGSYQNDLQREKAQVRMAVVTNSNSLNENAAKTQVAREWVEAERKPDLVDSFGNTNSAVRNKGLSEDREKEEKLRRERERLRKIEEERERQIEREKDRMAVDRATLEAHETRERSERAAVERATAEFRKRALAEARERLEKACTEARERSLAEKASEGRLRVEKATAEARERAERSVVDKFQKAGSFSGLRAVNSGGSEGESPQRCKARLERHQRTADRAAKALAEKNTRDLIAQKEQVERNRLAEGLDAEVKRWSSGKQGNLRALLSTLQYILGPESGWQPVPLTEVITTAAVKKAYRKATLCVHPDKLQQRGASIHQKYICEKVFDLLKEAWNKFNSEER